MLAVNVQVSTQIDSTPETHTLEEEAESDQQHQAAASAGDHGRGAREPDGMAALSRLGRIQYFKYRAPGQDILVLNGREQFPPIITRLKLSGHMDHVTTSGLQRTQPKMLFVPEPPAMAGDNPKVNQHLCAALCWPFQAKMLNGSASTCTISRRRQLTGLRSRLLV